MDDTRATIDAYWTTVNARDWPAFGALLTTDVVYDMPQTRERVCGREDYVRFQAEYPGDWRITVERVVADGRRAATWIRFVVSGEDVPGLTFFELDGDGLIAHITDFWPEPYEPPAGREHLTERY